MADSGDALGFVLAAEEGSATVEEHCGAGDTELLEGILEGAEFVLSDTGRTFVFAPRGYRARSSILMSVDNTQPEVSLRYLHAFRIDAQLCFSKMQRLVVDAESEQGCVTRNVYMPAEMYTKRKAKMDKIITRVDDMVGEFFDVQFLFTLRRNTVVGTPMAWTCQSRLRARVVKVVVQSQTYPFATNATFTVQPECNVNVELVSKGFNLFQPTLRLAQPHGQRYLTYVKGMGLGMVQQQQQFDAPHAFIGACVPNPALLAWVLLHGTAAAKLPEPIVQIIIHLDTAKRGIPIGETQLLTPS